MLQSSFKFKSFVLHVLVKGLRYVNRPYIFRYRSSEDETDFREEEFTYLTSVTKAQFSELFTYCDPIPVQRGHRRVSVKDLLYSIKKLRQGLSDIRFESITRQQYIDI